MIILYSAPTKEGEQLKNQRGLRGAWRLFLVQISVSIGVAALGWFFFDLKVAKSVMFAGLVWLLPQVCFVQLLFRDQRARFSRESLARVYRGEALKLFLSAGLFAGVFRWGNVAPGVFFAAYFLAQAIFWFAPLFFRATLREVRLKTS